MVKKIYNNMFNLLNNPGNANKKLFQSIRLEKFYGVGMIVGEMNSPTNGSIIWYNHLTMQFVSIN